MKEFSTNFQGLLPIFLNDLRFMQSSYQEQIEAILKPFMNEDAGALSGYILTGCEITGNSGNYSVSSGWVVLFGKPYRVPAHNANIAVPSGELKWSITETQLPDGVKQPKRTTNEVHTHIDKIAILVESNPGFPRYSETGRYEDILQYIAAPDPIQDSGWVTVSVNTGWTATHPLQYRKIGNRVYWRGLVRYNSGYEPIASIPSNVMPSVLTVVKVNSDADVSVVMDPQGNDELYVNDFPDGNFVHFDSFTYLTD